MNTLVNENKSINLSIPIEMADNRLVKKLMSLIRFRELTKEIDVPEDKIFELTEEIQENWWKENKDLFLKGVKP